MSDLRFLRELGAELERVSDLKERRSSPGRLAPWRRAPSVLALMASVLIVVGVAALFVTASKGARHGGSPSSPPTGPSGGPVPAGFDPQWVTAVSDQRWWVLGQRPCGRKACLSILRTTNGGRSFVSIPTPKGPGGSGGCPNPPVWRLTFADTRDGFAYGCSLYITHDGGAHWEKSLPVRGSVSLLTVAGGYVYFIIELPDRSGYSSDLFRSPVRRDAFTLLFPRGASSVPPVGNGLAARGSDVFVLSWGGRTLMISHDRTRFSHENSLGLGLPCTIQPVTTRVVWAFCSGGMDGSVVRSTNGGHSFIGADGQKSGPLALGEYHGAVFAAADSSTAVVGFERLLRTTNAGRSYTPVGPTGLEWEQLSFIDPRHAIALAAPPKSDPAGSHLYLSSDGGISYHLVPIRSATAGRASRGDGVRCRSSQLKLGIGQSVTPKTQQNPLLLTLRNASNTSCELEGYARIVLLDRHGAILPFSYGRHGDQELTNHPPGQVSLAPGGEAYIGLNQTACTLKVRHYADQVRVMLSKEAHPLSLVLRYYNQPMYCGPRDPTGQTVDVSPIEATERAVFALP